MSVKLYVGNLPYSVNSQQLSDVFSQAGNVVSANVITFQDSGKSRGFGFVEMETEQDAEKAIEKFNDFDLDGRKLIVDKARPMRQKSGGFKRSFNRG